MANPSLIRLRQDEVVAVQTVPDYKAEAGIYRAALLEIIKSSQVLKTNPNCLYILRVAENAIQEADKKKSPNYE